jgi:hypothetical protein
MSVLAACVTSKGICDQARQVKAKDAGLRNMNYAEEIQ